ncbi:MAG: hypothetical protein Q9187_000894 [Circinaria calcarea]
MAMQTPNPIAIIGIGCRLPGGVTNTEELWQLLLEGWNTWSSVPAQRFNEAAFYHPNPDNNGTTNHRGGHFITQDIAAFDTTFFGISPVEAQSMDPQQRLLLETTYEAFENAGIPAEAVRGSKTAVYNAMFTRDYDRNIYKDPSDIPKYQTTGSGEAIISNRISYIFDLRGPSMTLDTGCSGSMVALHLACQSLRTGESDMAVVSGVNLILNPDHMFGMSNLHMLNDTGRSYPFDARGSGYGRGEGVVVIILKRLDDALKATDSIRAIIRNSAVNQDGKTSGISLPSQEAQESLQQSIYRYANLDPQNTRYIEAHGTGTSAGDLAELRAIRNVFCKDDHSQNSLYVGSIKSNIGHLESSSGLAGLIKTVLILEKGYIPPNADFQTPKKDLKLGKWKIKIPLKLEPWPELGVRRASVNSFGYGGTNAHVILESACTTIAPNGKNQPYTIIDDYVKQTLNRELRVGNAQGLLITQEAQTIPKQEITRGIDQKAANSDNSQSNNGIITTTESDNRHQDSSAARNLAPQLLVVSAKSEKSLYDYMERLKSWASTKHDCERYLYDLAYNLSSRRSMMQWRYSFVASSHQEIMASLNHKDLRVNKTCSDIQVGFVFTGQGAQWFAMGRELVYTQSRFADSLIRSDKILRELGATWSLMNELLVNEPDSRINQSQLAQPACTALQIALIDLLASININPNMVLGHSSGEIAAAYSAGVLSQAMALKVSYHRSSISSLCRQMVSKEGAMLSVGLGEDQLSPLLTQTRRGIVSIACINSPTSTTISGDLEAVLELEVILSQRNIFCRRLKVDTAYHSHHMQKVANEYLRSMDVIDTQSLRDNVKFMSTVTAVEKTFNFGAPYWMENLISKVRFYDALQEYCSIYLARSHSNITQPIHILIEVGPHSVLAGPIRQTIAHRFGSFRYGYLPTLIRGRSAVRSMLELAGKMFEYGYPINLKIANCLNHSQRLSAVMHNLPTYPWDHSNTYWYESRLSKDYRLRQHPSHDLLGVRIVGSTSLEPRWRYVLGIESTPWLAEHVVDGLIIFPGAGYICMAVEAIRQFTHDLPLGQGIQKFILKNVLFSKALVIPDAPGRVEIQLSFRTEKSATGLWYKFRVYAFSQDEIWYEHCRGLITVDLVSSLMEGYPNDLYPKAMATEEEFLDTVRYPQVLTSNKIYDQLRANGNVYGPLFAAIHELRLGNFQAVGQIYIPDVQSVMPSNYMQPHVIHPTTLDALMHTALPLYSQHYGPGSIMPVFVGEITVSADITNTRGKKLLSVTTLAPNGARSANADLLAYEAGPRTKHEPVLTISRAELRGFGHPRTGESNALAASKMVYQMIWATDVDYFPRKTKTSSCSITLHEYLKHMYFKYSNMKLLQLQAGTGPTALSFLRALNDEVFTFFNRYDFTDTSIESFHQAKDLLQDWIGVVHFRALDITHEPVQQGFVEHSYDLVLATTNLCKTNSLEHTMTNIRKLLRLGGRLMLIAEESSPLSQIQWHNTLQRYSFSGVELTLEQNNRTRQLGTVMVSRAIIAGYETPIHPIEIIAENGTEMLGHKLSLALNDHGFKTSLITWCSDLLKSQIIYIIIDNGQKPQLINCSPDRFKQITQLAGGKASVFWLSAQEEPSAIMNPEKGLVTGLARSARAENENLKFITFDVQEAIHSWSQNLLNAITDILSKSFHSTKQIGQITEAEYTYRDGKVLIPRLIPDEKINSWMSRTAGEMTVERHAYGRLERPVKLKMLRPGSIESLRYVVEEPGPTFLDPSCIEIAVEAHAVSPRDVTDFLCQTRPSFTKIREFAGTVRTVGSEARVKFQVGDRVCAWSHDGVPYSSRLRIGSENAHRLPDSVSLAVGAALPLPFMAAYYGLVEFADLQKGQTILIHRAAGAIGQAALAIARSIGAEVFCTVSSLAERENLVKRYELSSMRIFSETAPGLKNSVLRLTQGKGVNVVLNSLAADSNFESRHFLALFGVYILVGEPEAHLNTPMKIPTTDKNITVLSFDLASLTGRQPQKVAMLLRKVMSMIEAGTLVADQYVTTFSVADVRSAFQTARAENFIGKVVLEGDEFTQVDVLSTHHTVSQLDGDSTYVIAGGLGDLGRRLCHLMASRGAKYLVTLSRRTLDLDEKQAFQDDLRSTSAGLVFYSIACDISNMLMLQEVVAGFEAIGLPPVRGVIQSATVLQDRVLERMTADVFGVPLQSKMHGTRCLNRAFQTSPLDFFIMLSSLSGTVGSKGQANYAAGNTFQDAVAHNEMSSKTHYMSLNLGMIEGTSAYEDTEGQARLQNLLRQGWIPVKSEELLAFLDYAISPEARKDQRRQAVIGIDGASIGKAENATPTTRSPIFVHLQIPHASDGHSQNNSVVRSKKEVVACAQSLIEKHQIIIEAIARKLSVLVALSYDKISWESPLMSFGLDSLTAIELKNWIAQEFDAAIQASEILDGPSIVALSAKIASRMTFIHHDPQTKSEQYEGAKAYKKETATLEQKQFFGQSQHNGDPIPSLPQLPLPDLDETLDLYLTSASAFLPEDGFKHASDSIQNFRKGSGWQLQKRLMERTQDPQIDSWQHDLQVNGIYLSRRDPVYPYGIFYGVHLLTDIPHGQAERAAVISVAAYKFKQRINAGKPEQDYLNEEPICMKSLRWLFNANRRACVGKDEMCQYPGNDYLIALRRGHIFKVVLISQGENASYIELKAAFEAIIDNSQATLPSVATLSADGRDSWAELRKTVKAVDTRNDELIDLIEAAAFIVCLDDGAPDTPTNRCNQFLLGDPSNRWSDKSLQFVICENGVSAYVCEHSMLDAASLKQINQYISQSILDHKPDAQLNGSLHENAKDRPGMLGLQGDRCENIVQEHTFTTTEEIESHIGRVRRTFLASHARAEFAHFYLSTIGMTFLRTHKLPSKTGCQLIIQLASLLHFGQQHPCWETLNMMPFDSGRLDWMQVVLPAMFAFCSAAIEDHTRVAVRRRLLYEAATTHASTMMRIGRGKGFAAHLEALREMLHEDEPIPAFFTDPTWEMMHVTSPRMVKTDASEGLMVQEAGFLMPDPKSVWVHYEVEEDGCRFYVQSTEGQTGPFCQALEQAADKVREILED